jgi:hypothetical protein
VSKIGKIGLIYEKMFAITKKAWKPVFIGVLVSIKSISPIFRYRRGFSVVIKRKSGVKGCKYPMGVQIPRSNKIGAPKPTDVFWGNEIRSMFTPY